MWGDVTDDVGKKAGMSLSVMELDVSNDYRRGRNGMSAYCYSAE